MRKAVDALVAAMRAEGLAATTIETNEYRLKHFFRLPANDHRSLRWLNGRGEELYTAAQVKRRPDTHQAELGLAKQLGELAVKQRWLKTNPFASVERVGRKTHGSTKPRLHVDESRKLREHCLELGADGPAVVTLAYLLLGSRASELVRRDVRDLDDGGAMLWISRTKTKAGVRRLIIPHELRAPLLALVKGRPGTAPIFLKADGARATRRWAIYHVQRLCKDAKVPVLTPQALRRTFSDLAEEANESSIAVAAHLGQTSARVTERSYRDRQVSADARSRRAFGVIAGGLP